MEPKIDPKEYVWVVVDITGAEENFVGLTNDAGEQFIPVCASKDQAEALLAQIPAEGDRKRQAEAIHKDQLLKEAAENGFDVFLVDQNGTLLGRLGGISN